MTKIIAVVALVAAATACSVPSADELRVVRQWDLNSFEPFSGTVHDRDAIAALSAKIRSLPAARTDVFCPIDFSLHYDLDFRHDGTQVLHAVAQAGGCRTLSLGAGDVRQTDESFWAMLAGDLGFYTRGNDLFPMPVFGH